MLKIEELGDYWQLPSKRQAGVRKLANVMTVHGWNQYSVVGTFRYAVFECECTWIYHEPCDCPAKNYRTNVNIVVAARDEQEASWLVMYQEYKRVLEATRQPQGYASEIDEDDWGWDGEPRIEEVKEGELLIASPTAPDAYLQPNLVWSAWIRGEP